MKKLLIGAGLLAGLAVSQAAHARTDTFINDTAYRATGKVVYGTIFCTNNAFDLQPGASMTVNAKACEIDKIETTVFVDIISDPTRPRTRASAKYDEVGAAEYKGQRRWQKDTTYKLRTEYGSRGEESFRWVRSTK